MLDGAYFIGLITETFGKMFSIFDIPLLQFAGIPLGWMAYALFSVFVSVLIYIIYNEVVSPPRAKINENNNTFTLNKRKR